jgi:Spy/CpxP family protein refolding chaperone
MKSILVLFAFILTSGFVSAQQAQTTALTPNQERAHVKAVQLQKLLALTEGQTASIETIYVAQFNEIDAINADVNKTQEQKDTEIATVRKTKDKEVMAVLTPEQQTKFTETKQQHKDRKNGNTQGQ